ncbi:hypothetical protein O181_022184 [Austropuccinia psidii MF-1]|uniref:Uncharacterized protein n=1 Tax=Austropuccinia psidii MF-1 TaxID=1389203 RepID=A0A9Q3GXF1_9BASI|nr:hypothetical protein [Austropuccinia psidii MF-1]
MEPQQEVQTDAGKRSQDNRESSHYPSPRKTTELDREYLDSFSLPRSIPSRLPTGLRHSGTSRSVTNSHHSSQSQVIYRRRKVLKGKKQLF